MGVQRYVEEENKPFNIDDFKRQLTLDYRTKLDQMGVDFTHRQLGNSVVFTKVIKAIIDVIGQTSTNNYAIYAMNSFLKKIDTKFDFLKNIKITPLDSDELCDINIMANLDDLSDTEIRRSIQKLLEEIVRSIGDELEEIFINEFKKSLEKNCLSRIEEIGVNLHMIELRRDLLRRNN